ELTTMTETLDLNFEQIRIAADSPLDGKKLKDSGIRSEHSAMIVAITSHTGEMIFNPNGEQELHAGDLLIAIGTGAGLTKLGQIANPRQKVSGILGKSKAVLKGLEKSGEVTRHTDE